MNQTAQARIMVVGGDSYFAYIIRRYLRMSSHQIILASLADDIDALIKNEKPSAIVLEVDSLESMGWQLLRTLKKSPSTDKTSIILCSWIDDEQRGLDEGADVFLHMPILYQDFGAALEAIGIPTSLNSDEFSNPTPEGEQ